MGQQCAYKGKISLEFRYKETANSPVQVKKIESQRISYLMIEHMYENIHPNTRAQHRIHAMHPYGGIQNGGPPYSENLNKGKHQRRPCDKAVVIIRIVGVKRLALYLT